MKKIILVSAVALFSSASFAAEKPPMLINVKRISMETALTIAKAGIDACRKEGVNVAVTVVDRTGDIQVVLRDVITPKIALSISEGKAHAAVAFNAPTSSLESRASGALGKVEGLIFGAGGIPIQAQGRILGGIGVSGAPSGELDEKCARAGLDAVLDELEMAE